MTIIGIDQLILVEKSIENCKIRRRSRFFAIYERFNDLYSSRCELKLELVFTI